MKKINVLDLFAGGGGFSTGFQMAKLDNYSFEIIRAVEINDDACNTLRSHLGTKRVIQGDITTKEIKRKIYRDCRDVDVIIGGPPCQTFSLAGPARSGSKEMRELLKNDPRNTLYKHFFEIVKELSPSFVVFENVEGMASKKVEADVLSKKHKQVIELICDELESLGYTTSIEESLTKRYRVLNAADYDVPQYRKRIIIIANKYNMINPEPTKLGGTKTVFDAINKLPLRLPKIAISNNNRLKNMDIIIKNYEKCLTIFIDKIKDLEINSNKNVEKKKISILYENLYDLFLQIKDKKSYKHYNLQKFLKFYNDEIERLGLSQNISISNSNTSHSSRIHNFRDIIIFILTKQGSNSSRFMNKESDDYDELLDKLYPYDRTKHKDTYVKYAWDRPSNTILAHMEKDGLKFIHPEQPRTLTPYEAAIIQSFPKDYSFSGGRNAQYRQIGNAVPPRMAKAIGETILKMVKENNIWMLNKAYESAK